MPTLAAQGSLRLSTLSTVKQPSSPTLWMGEDAGAERPQLLLPRPATAPTDSERLTQVSPFNATKPTCIGYWNADISACRRRWHSLDKEGSLVELAMYVKLSPNRIPSPISVLRKVLAKILDLCGVQ